MENDREYDILTSRDGAVNRSMDGDIIRIDEVEEVATPLSFSSRLLNLLPPQSPQISYPQRESVGRGLDEDGDFAAIEQRRDAASPPTSISPSRQREVPESQSLIPPQSPQNYPTQKRPRALDEDIIQIEHAEDIANTSTPMSLQHNRGHSESQNTLPYKPSTFREYPISKSRHDKKVENKDKDVIDIRIAQSEEIPARPTTPVTHSHSHSHRRGKSESQNLLEAQQQSPRLMSGNRYSAINLRYDYPENTLVAGGRESPLWSGVPQYLSKRHAEKWRDFIYDVLVALVILPFFALAGCGIWKNGKRVDADVENILDESIKIASTFYPLMFSFVVGRALVHLASYKLEKGTSLGFLETVMGSQTFGRAFITQFQILPFKILGIKLIALWCLSPIGSQAVLRMLYTAPQNMMASGSITHLNTRQASYSGTADFETWFSSFATMFGAALLEPGKVKNGSLDLLGNVKIPYFSSIPSKIQEDENGWKQLPPPISFTPVYSSLFGIPVSALSGNSNTTFNMESSYLELSCENRTSEIARDPLRNLDFNSPNLDLIGTNMPFISAENVTFETKWGIGYLGPDVTSLSRNTSTVTTQSLDSLPSNTTAYLPGILLYQDLSGAKNVTSIYCTLEQQYIESSIACNASTSTLSFGTKPNCHVVAQRQSLLQYQQPSLTPLSFQKIFLGLSSGLPNATITQNNIDILQNYLANPFLAQFIQTTPYAYLSESESRLLDISLQDFGRG